MAQTTTRETRPATSSGSVERRRSRGRPQVRCDEETRGVILEAARHEFAASGFAATSMENVARHAGVSTKTLYRLLPDKKTLFAATVTHRLDRFVSVVSLRACEGGDIDSALPDALLACAELVLDPEVIALQRMILADSDKFPDIPEMFYIKAMRRSVAALAEWLDVQLKRGLIVLDDVEAAAGMLLGMLVFQPQRDVMFGHKPPPTRGELERRAKTCSALFLRGCRRGSVG
ncbi:MAG: TetR/AcrR family transcriptional regulator [Alphaproteobacteria bacterium]|nr:MAG: TetR/AcrR family transcriptional regulator [Alphaproteobacteria bacterium]